METALAPPKSSLEESLREELGPIARALATRYFAPVRFPAEGEAELTRLHARGFVLRVLKPGVIDWIFGSPEAPGFLHTLLAFWRNYHRAHLRLGEPIDLRRFIGQNPADSDQQIARKVRGALYHHLSRETRAVFGPPSKPAERLIDEALRDRTLRRSLEDFRAAK